MAHVLDLEALAHGHPGGAAGGAGDVDAPGSRIAVRLLGCAIAMLIVSFLVVSRSSAAFRSEGASTSSTFRSGVMTLRDDDGGASLFDLPALVPGDAGERCITVSYEGDVGSAVVALRGEGGGRLADALALTIDGGRGGRFGDCEGFEPEVTLFEGTLRDLLTRYHRGSDGLTAYTTSDGTTARSFRFRFRLPEDFADQGSTASADFLWTATPARTG